jgi:hypothetical protein
MRIALRLGSALALLVTAILAFGQQTRTAGCAITYENQNQVDYGPIGLRKIHGTVLDQSSGPVPSVCLGIFSERDHVLIVSAESHADGRFTFPPIPAGLYRLVAKYNGFAVANVSLKIRGWPAGGLFTTASLYLHMRPRGIDTASYVDLKP